MKSPDIAK